MYCSSQYCHTKSRLNNKKLTIGGSLKNNIAVPIGIKTVSLNGVVLRCGKYVKVQHNKDGKLHKQRNI